MASQTSIVSVGIFKSAELCDGGVTNGLVQKLYYYDSSDANNYGCEKTFADAGSKTIGNFQLLDESDLNVELSFPDIIEVTTPFVSNKANDTSICFYGNYEVTGTVTDGNLQLVETGKKCDDDSPLIGEDRTWKFTSNCTQVGDMGPFIKYFFDEATDNAYYETSTGANGEEVLTCKSWENKAFTRTQVLKPSLEWLQENAKAKDTVIQTQEGEIKDKEADIGIKQEDIKNLETKIEGQKTTIGKKNKTISEKDVIIGEKDEDINTAEQKVDKLTADLEKLKVDLATLTSDRNGVQTNLDEVQADLDKATSDLKDTKAALALAENDSEDPVAPSDPTSVGGASVLMGASSLSLGAAAVLIQYLC